MVAIFRHVAMDLHTKHASLFALPYCICRCCGTVRCTVVHSSSCTVCLLTIDVVEFHSVLRTFTHYRSRDTLKGLTRRPHAYGATRDTVDRRHVQFARSLLPSTLGKIYAASRTIQNPNLRDMCYGHHRARSKIQYYAGGAMVITRDADVGAN